MTDAGFIRAILASPDEDQPRLVYADWLEEQGDVVRAEFIRVQIELARMGVAPYGAGPAVEAFKYRRDVLRRRMAELRSAYGGLWAHPLIVALGVLFEPSEEGGGRYKYHGYAGAHQGETHAGWEWRRGFVESVTVKTAYTWILRGPAVVRTVPTLRNLKIEDLDAEFVDRDPGFPCWRRRVPTLHPWPTRWCFYDTPEQCVEAQNEAALVWACQVRDKDAVRAEAAWEDCHTQDRINARRFYKRDPGASGR
jgi:uncharacterized protein (TIGR02996 family)